MSRIAVMHLTDTLDMGGAERVAVDLVNCLPQDRYAVCLCTTRRDGPLSGLVASHVERLRLGRRHRFDPMGLARLVGFIREREVKILHAHSTSLFLAVTASWFFPNPAVIWHDHFGRYAVEERSIFLHRLAAGRVSCVIAVNEPLAEWSRRKLRVPASRVLYIPNFVRNSEPSGDSPILPGTPGARIISVANLRPEKDHHTLLSAMALVVRQVPRAHLLLVGATRDNAYTDQLQKQVLRHGLASNVFFLGERHDVPSLLRACDLGVLSSCSEGLPLALIEYGAAGLAAVATRVGQCAEVLDEGRAGILVPPRSPEQLAEALLSLIQSPSRRAELGERFRQRVQQFHSASAIIEQVCCVYNTVLSGIEPPGKHHVSCADARG